MTALSFSVRGIAVPFVRVSPGKGGSAFDDPDYARWKSMIASAARDAADRVAWKTATGPIRLDVVVVLVKRPTKNPDTSRWPTSARTGDFDNHAKPVADGLQRALIFKNDAQIVSAVLEKRWQADREEFAGAIVRVEVLE